MTLRHTYPAKSANLELSSSFQLVTVQPETITQFVHDPPSLETGLRELAKRNFELTVRLRIEATKKFPDDLNARQLALSIAVMSLGLLESQLVKNELMGQFATDVTPGPVSPAAVTPAAIQ